MLSLQCAKFPSPPPTSPPTRLAQRPFFSCGRLLPVFGFFVGTQKGQPTRAPQAVMSTRQGLSPLSTSKNQLDAVYADAVWKRLDAETVWLNCPTLSKEGGRRLGADWSIVSDPVQRYLRMERNGHEWAKAAVREDLDSPAFYLFAMWWASVREIHEAFREERAALEETPQHLKVAHAASARNHQARAAEKTRIEAFAAEVGIN